MKQNSRLVDGNYEIIRTEFEIWIAQVRNVIELIMHDGQAYTNKLLAAFLNDNRHFRTFFAYNIECNTAYVIICEVLILC